MLQPPGTPLPTSIQSVSVLSYNVLIPNSGDGWWCYKYYGAHTPHEATCWAARSALLREQLLLANADIVMLQETAPESFASDWAFLTEEGEYDCTMHCKGRMRPATFWKRSKFALCKVDGTVCAPLPVPVGAAGNRIGAGATNPASAAAAFPPPTDTKGGAGAIHGDRTLTTILRRLAEDGTPAQPSPLLAINCHLSAGPEVSERTPLLVCVCHHVYCASSAELGWRCSYVCWCAY
jgi:hypothetical protein